MQAVRVAPGQLQGPFGDGRHAETVDVPHREDVDAGRDHPAALGGVEVADADEDGAGGLDRGGRPADGGELAGLRSQQRGERHAVDVAAGARIRRVHVAVRVDPEQAEASALTPGSGGGGGDGARGQAVIAAEDDGDGPGGV